MKRKPETIGEIGRFIDVGLDHGSRAWGRLLYDMGIDPEPPELISDNFEPGTTIYHLGAFLKYVKKAFGGFGNIGVSTSGQLCPYQDCCWMCGFDAESWYRCPNCLRVFFTNSTDSDIEDWHSFTELEFLNRSSPSRPDDIPLASNLGPSWATPDDNPAGRDKI